MEHEIIHDRELVRRYVQGSLDVAMRESFEDHYVGCEACQESIAWETELHGAMRATAAEDTARAQNVVRAGLFAFLARQSAWRRGLVLAATAALAIVPFAGWQREHAAHQETRARADLPVTHGADGVTQPGINTPLFYLDATRGASDQTTRLPTPTTPTPVILVMELDDTGVFADHRAVLEYDSEVLWRQDGLVANAFGAFVITVPPGYWNAGAYRLRLEGLRDAAPPVVVGDYRFEVAPAMPSSTRGD